MNNPLGKATEYKFKYDKSMLFPIARKDKRAEIGIEDNNFFNGYDVFNLYELSWLNAKNKPQIALGKLCYSAKSDLIIESKSLKLYLNSFNNTNFEHIDDVKNLIIKDLKNTLQTEIFLELYELDSQIDFDEFEGESLDKLDIELNYDRIYNDILVTGEEIVGETLKTDLLCSKCLITGQPDWGSLKIDYKGKKILRENLLKYVCSLRNQNEFHEQCIERIFVDILNKCKPESLTIHGRYTRRGGIDINPYRSTEPVKLDQLSNFRLVRQ